MNLKLFCLIHNERPYRHYYYQPNSLKHPNKLGWLWEIKCFFDRYAKAVVLPFHPKYNTQQFSGSRKSKLRMLWENMVWCFKYKETCRYYFLYGLDLKGRNPKDYVAYTEFRVLRNILNFRQRENLPTLYTFNYLALARDKFVFYQYCKSLGMPYPQTIGLVSKGEVSWYDGKRMEFSPLESILEKSFDSFCKEVNGESGKGAFCLKAENGKLFDREEEIFLDELRRRFGNATFIIQEKLKNHPTIDAVYDKSLNTIKLITILNDDGTVDFFDSVMRFGAGGNFVDNASRGGVFVGIEEDGTLQEVGYHEPGIKKNLVVPGVHPDTGVQFGGMKIPYWNELLTTAKRFHKFFYGIPSIGWDVAITPDGFVFTETGEDWEIPVYQVTHGGLHDKFYKYHDKALNVKLRRY